MHNIARVCRRIARLSRTERTGALLQRSRSQQTFGRTCGQLGTSVFVSNTPRFRRNLPLYRINMLLGIGAGIKIHKRKKAQREGQEKERQEKEKEEQQRREAEEQKQEMARMKAELEQLKQAQLVQKGH